MKTLSIVLSIVWRIIINIITLIVVIAIFSIASTSFETVVLSVLFLIYLSVWTFSAVWGLHTIEFGEALGNELKTIKRLINKDNTEIKKEKAENKKQKMIKFYINASFQTIIYIITLYMLITAILSS